MKYLGQWQERCELIVEELARIDGVLVVEKLLDLLLTGGASETDSIGSFLLPSSNAESCALSAKPRTSISTTTTR